MITTIEMIIANLPCSNFESNAFAKEYGQEIL